MQNKLNVAVVFGGKSGEHEVSLMSATNVINAMDKDKYNIYTIGITKQGKWMLYQGPVDKLQDGSWEQEASKLNGNELIELLLSPMIDGNQNGKIDAIFPVLHGPNGEDGTIQGFFEMLDMPYVGCGVIGSSLGMDKAISKQLFIDAGLNVADYILTYKHEIKDNLQEVIKKIESKFEYPVFVKPVNMGSSVGITKAHDRAELESGLLVAAKHDRKILIEEFIKGSEIECAVLGNNYPEASGVGEIIPSKEFYDYEAKYFDDGKSTLIIPARLTEEEESSIREAAVRAFKALDCCGMSRVDFFLDRSTGRVYINEINTIPGFTKISMYPKLWERAGLGYSKLIDRLIELAIERHNETK
ncbi:MAG: D-alanine--D-alanine ligase [Clostridia bacterium]|jgi:D-alanine-D-alanine ligase|nr:D-alanine--D-alanine ligase [Clostridia bacterium]